MTIQLQREEKIVDPFSNGTMPCRISDGPQEPDDYTGLTPPDEDEAYEQQRQQEIDDEPTEELK